MHTVKLCVCSIRRVWDKPATRKLTPDASVIFSKALASSVSQMAGGESA